MRKLIVSTYMTLDGVIDDPMWAFPYWADDIAEFQYNDLFAADLLLLGRETYEGFADAWTARAGTDAFADRINAMEKVLASRTLQTAGWNTSVIQGDVPDAVRKLKQQEGMNILKYGGGELLSTLVQHDLLDELHLLVFPIYIGGGARLVPDGSTGKLKLAETKTFSTGVVGLIYKPDTGA